MFNLNANEEIGKYLSELIIRKYKSYRQFSKKCIEAEGRDGNDDRLIDNMSNRISQIVKGKKSVQLSDLPMFTRLLDVSCEEILSAGECFGTTSNHLTNYDVAFTEEQDVWEAYVHREDKIILNTDEYGKTIIDYALEFKNFKLLKYFMKQGYIWFVDDVNDWNVSDIWTLFQGGTSIEPRPFRMDDDIRWHFYPTDKTLQSGRIHQLQQTNELQCELKYTLAGSDDLRRKMIILAIENNEVDLMDQLRARENFSLYILNERPMNRLTMMGEDVDSYYDEDVLVHIAGASEQILDYFSKTFEITNRFGRTDKFIFPYMTYLLDCLIKNNSSYSEKMLKCAIEHNLYAYKRLKRLVANATQEHVKYYMQFQNEEDYRNEEERKLYRQYKKTCREQEREKLKENIYFYGCDNIIISFWDVCGENKFAMVTTVVHTNENSSDNRINSLIDELNDLYHKICNIKGTLPEQSNCEQTKLETDNVTYL